MKLRVYSDGGARGNPGPAAIGVLVCDEKDEELQEHQDTIGEATNNVAEYCALVAALELARKLGAAEVEAFLDSELVVHQVRGEYKINSEPLRRLCREVKATEKKFKKVTYGYLPRTHERMRLVDKMVNQALNEAMT